MRIFLFLMTRLYVKSRVYAYTRADSRCVSVEYRESADAFVFAAPDAARNRACQSVNVCPLISAARAASFRADRFPPGARAFLTSLSLSGPRSFDDTGAYRVSRTFFLSRHADVSAARICVSRTTDSRSLRKNCGIDEGAGGTAIFPELRY